jgi:hypothetical protein
MVEHALFVKSVQSTASCLCLCFFGSFYRGSWSAFSRLACWADWFAVGVAVLLCYTRITLHCGSRRWESGRLVGWPIGQGHTLLFWEEGEIGSVVGAHSSESRGYHSEEGVMKRRACCRTMKSNIIELVVMLNML